MSLSFASGFIRSVCNVLDSNRNSRQVFTRIFMNSETIEIFQSLLAGPFDGLKVIFAADFGLEFAAQQHRGPRRDPMCLGSSKILRHGAKRAKSV